MLAGAILKDASLQIWSRRTNVAALIVVVPEGFNKGALLRSRSLDLGVDKLIHGVPELGPDRYLVAVAIYFHEPFESCSPVVVA